MPVGRYLPRRLWRGAADRRVPPTNGWRRRAPRDGGAGGGGWRGAPPGATTAPLHAAPEPYGGGAAYGGGWRRQPGPGLARRAQLSSPLGGSRPSMAVAGLGAAAVLRWRRAAGAATDSHTTACLIALRGGTVTPQRA